jgi:hypothetical protein
MAETPATSPVPTPADSAMNNAATGCYYLLLYPTLVLFVTFFVFFVMPCTKTPSICPYKGNNFVAGV